jgi:hypothetical protein
VYRNLEGEAREEERNTTIKVLAAKNYIQTKTMDLLFPAFIWPNNCLPCYCLFGDEHSTCLSYALVQRVVLLILYAQLQGLTDSHLQCQNRNIRNFIFVLKTLKRRDFLQYQEVDGGL